MKNALFSATEDGRVGQFFSRAAKKFQSGVAKLAPKRRSRAVGRTYVDNRKGDVDAAQCVQKPAGRKRKRERKDLLRAAPTSYIGCSIDQQQQLPVSASATKKNFEMAWNKLAKRLRMEPQEAQARQSCDDVDKSSLSSSCDECADSAYDSDVLLDAEDECLVGVESCSADEAARLAALPATDVINEAALAALSQQIVQHFLCNLQDRPMLERKLELRALLHNALQRGDPALFADCQLFPVGSTVSLLGSYNSDMDLCLVRPQPSGLGCASDRRFEVDVLMRARRVLRGLPFVGRNVEFIPAKVPILRVQCMALHGRDGLEVDINCNNLSGIYNSHLLHYYALADWRFSALSLLLKHWAIVHGILNAKDGFLNSYSLILLTLHFLQCGTQPPVLPNLQRLLPHLFSQRKPFVELELYRTLPSHVQALLGRNRQSLASLLIGWFAYYARFAFEKYAISICEARLKSRARELPPQNSRFWLYIEEPFDELNTARCVLHELNFRQIETVIEHSYHALLQAPSLDAIGVRL